MSDAYLERCARRRERVLQALGPDGAMVLPAGPELRYGRDGDLPYHADAELYYLTALTEPEAVAVLRGGEVEQPCVLFVRPKDPAAELWTGLRLGPEAARERLGVDAAYPLSELAERLPALIGDAERVYFRIPADRSEMQALLLRLLEEGRKGRQRKGAGPRAVIDPGVILDDMRLIKDDVELARIREAARVSVDAFRTAATAIRPGAGEWQVQAELEAAFRRCRAAPAFGSIAAAGAGATVLHYVANDRTLGAGELLLLDAGACLDGYSADITRTFPVSGRFNAEQRALYDVVLAAHSAAIAAVRPGATEADVHGAAVRELVAGLLDMGALEGELDALIEEPDAYHAFYPHRTSHWLGLEVHDVGDYAHAGEPRPLEPGMVLTVEPGLYVAAGIDADSPMAPLAGTGIRIEDDVLVTTDGHEVLTAALPVAADDVAALVGARP